MVVFEVLRDLNNTLQQLLIKWCLLALPFPCGAEMITQLAGLLIPPNLFGPVLLVQVGGQHHVAFGAAAEFSAFQRYIFYTAIYRCL